MRPVLIATLLTLASLAAGWAAPAAAQCTGPQATGAFPRLVLRDGMGTEVPDPLLGPFDSSHVIGVVGGQFLEIEVTYKAVGAPTSVIWAILLSAHQTAAPTDVCPPPLYTAPPFNVLFFNPVTLDGTGKGSTTVAVPTGIYVGDAYLQGIIHDPASPIGTQVSNGVKVSFEVPGFNVSYAHVLNQPGTTDSMKQLGRTDIAPDLGRQLQPFGPLFPPAPVAFNVGLNMGVFRFRDILPNEPDYPNDPLARPVARLTQAYSGIGSTTYAVDDTAGFPRRGFLISPVAPAVVATQSPQTRNPYADPVLAGTQGVNVEYLSYKGLTPTTFEQITHFLTGSKGMFQSSQVAHVVNEWVVGEFTMTTSTAALARSRVCLDASNREAPHVVLPAFTFTPPGDGGPVTMDLDLFLFENTLNGQHGFIVLDRITNNWRFLEGTLKTESQGNWDPLIAVAPDRRSFLAVFRPKDGTLGWDHDADQVFMIRVDGLSWPASGSQTWQLNYELFTGTILNDVRARKVRMRSSFILGPDPDNYVAYVALDHKFKFTPFGLGNNRILDPNDPLSALSVEAQNPREEVRHRDLAAFGLVPPGSAKTPSPGPAPLINSVFGTTGFGDSILRFDPGVMLTPDRTMALVCAGHATFQEDAYVVRDVGIASDGSVIQNLLNISGHRAVPTSAGQFAPVALRSWSAGGHGIGGKAAISPSGARAAWLAQVDSRRDWIQIARTDGFDFAKVLNVGQSLVDGTFREGPANGPLKTNRVVSGLVWAGEDALVFMMGRMPYSDPFAVDNVNDTPAMDLFSYHIPTDTLTNLTQTGGTAFSTLGKLAPGGHFVSPDGRYAYYVRRGKVGPGASVAEGTVVTNLIGVNLQTLQVFDVTGDEIGTGSIIPHLTVPSPGLFHPVESLVPLNFAAGAGVQEGMIYFTAREIGGNDAANVYALNTDAPFVRFPVTDAATAGAIVRNLSPNPHGAQVAFSRSLGATPLTNNERPIIVDMTSFLFERTLLTEYPPGRLMDGSIHWLPATGNAPVAMVYSFGLFTIGPFATANTGAPDYYPLTNLTDTITEPVPKHIPLSDTILLPVDSRFYLMNAIPFPGP